MTPSDDHDCVPDNQREMDIKPRIDADGVPWCDAECPQVYNLNWMFGWHCRLDGDIDKPQHQLCPHAVKRMAVEIEQLCAKLDRARLAMDKQGFDWCEKMEQLCAKLAAAEKDTARLDWLEENNDRLADALMTNYLREDIRAAIDKAKEGE